MSSRRLNRAAVGAFTACLALATTVVATPAHAAADPVITLSSPSCVEPGANLTVHAYARAAAGEYLTLGSVYPNSRHATVNLTFPGQVRYAEQEVTVPASGSYSSDSYDFESTVTDSAGNQSYEDETSTDLINGCADGDSSLVPGVLNPSGAAIVSITAPSRATAGTAIHASARVRNVSSQDSAAGSVNWQVQLPNGTWSYFGSTDVSVPNFTATSPAWIAQRTTVFRASYTPGNSCSCTASTWSNVARTYMAPKIVTSQHSYATLSQVNVRVSPRPAGAKVHFQWKSGGGGWRTAGTASLSAKGTASFAIARPFSSGTYRVTSDQTPTFLAGASTPVFTKGRTAVTKVQWDCRHFLYRPKTIETCGDGSIYWTSVKYKTYSDTKATGTATEHWNDFIPDGASGHWHTRKVSIVLYSKATKSGRPLFTRLQHKYGKHVGSWALGGA